MTAPFIIPDFTGITHGRKPPYGQVRLNRNHPLARGLVGCWLMNESGGNTVYDLSGNRHHGALVNGPSWTGEGIGFDSASSQEINLGDNDDFSFTNGSNDIAFSAFVKGNWATSARGANFSKYNDNSPFDGEWGMTLNTSNQAYFQLLSDSASNNRLIAAATRTESGEGTYALTYDGSEDYTGLKAYEDGSEMSYSSHEEQGTYTGMVNRTTYLSIGGYIQDLGLYQDGETHLVLLWRNRELSASEIASLHANPYQIFEPVIPLPIVFGPEVGQSLTQDIAYRILNSIERDTGWKLLAAASTDIAYRILNSITRDIASKIFSSLDRDSSWAIMTKVERDISWTIINRLDRNLAWGILNTKDQITAWNILTQISRDTSWKVFTIIDQDLAWDILTYLEQDIGWQLFDAVSFDTAWDVFSDIVPEPIKVFMAERRTFIFNAEQRTFIFFA